MNGASVELFVRGTHALRRSGFWWAVGILALALVSVAFWPSLEGNSALTDLTTSSKSLLEAFGAQDLSTAAGYLDGQMYALMLPLLLSGLAIASTSALTAGDEDAGRLELLQALPVSRTSVWLARIVAAIAILALVTALTALVVALSLTPFSLDGISVARIVVVTFACGALGLFHGAVAYGAAGAGASRALAAGIAIAVLVIGYVASYLLPLSDALEGFRKLSPWYWAIGTQPVTNGISGGWMVLLLALTAVLVVFGTVAINRRDLRSA
ncbi:MAG TPA: ABC transporter permease subunit [Acidimicrobiia bacterium]|nr:ABC transporter permease subunit [Acidimicrobiia bacterium]